MPIAPEEARLKHDSNLILVASQLGLVAEDGVFRYYDPLDLTHCTDQEVQCRSRLTAER